MLHAPPMRQGALQLSFAAFRQPDSPFPAIVATAFSDPAAPFHDVERAGECGAIHREDLAQQALGHFSGEGEGLQDDELGGSQSKGAEGVFIELG